MTISPADVFAAGALIMAALDKLPKLASSSPTSSSPTSSSPTTPTPSGAVIIPAPTPAPVPTPATAPAPNRIPWPTVTTETTPGRMVPVPTPAVRQTAYAEPQNEEAAVIARERSPLDMSYWMYATKVTPEEQAFARARLAQWVKEGARGTQVWFTGPRTFKGRRQFRTARHGSKRAVEILQPRPPFVHQPSASASASASSSTRTSSGKPTLKLGSSGPAVRELQTKLGVTADGKFGPLTRDAVIAFQKRKGLTPDGIVGPATWAALG